MIEPHIPTIFMMVVVSCLSLAAAIGLAGGRGEGDGEGLRIWALALCVHAGGYFLFLTRGVLSDWAAVVVANALISSSLAMLAIAIARFRGRRLSGWTAILPVVVMGIGLSILIESMRGRIILSNLVLLAQTFLSVWVLTADPKSDATRGRDVLLFSLLISVGILTTRAAMGLVSPELAASLFQASGAQVATFVLSHMSVIITTGGFVMMTKARSDERLRRLAMRDRLTGCWNRVRVEEIAEQEMARLARYGHPVSLLMIDLDHFKDVNDRHGHAAGDEMLRVFVDTALDRIRSTDVLGRWGGEEFVVILPSTGIVEARHIAERVRAAVAGRAFPGDLRLTVSVGVSVCRSTDTWADWLERADAALYRAKADGRDLVRVESMESWEEGRSENGAPFLRLVWRPEFECGEPCIDAAHRALFEAVNELLLSGADERDRGEISASVVPLLAALRAHFAEEVAIMRKRGYDLVDQHEAEHTVLLKRAEEMLRRFGEGTVGVKDLVNFVVFELVSRHMLIDDPRFSHRSAEATGRSVDSFA